MSYDPNNIFARILRGEIPSHKVYEDQQTLALLDVMPQTDGHTLVIPKTPARGLLDVAPDVLARLIDVVQQVSRAAVKAFDADGFQIRQYNEPAGGQTIFHLHFHVLPMHDGQGLRPHSGKMADPAVLAAHAERIRTALRS